MVVYIHVAPKPSFVNTQLLDPPRGARPSWRPGVVPRGVNIEVLKPPPPPPRLGEPGTNPPRDAIEQAWDGGRLVVATFRPFDFGVGTGGFASVTTFLSDGMIEVLPMPNPFHQRLVRFLFRALEALGVTTRLRCEQG